jgi:hypothetical protein
MRGLRPPVRRALPVRRPVRRVLQPGSGLRVRPRHLVQSRVPRHRSRLRLQPGLPLQPPVHGRSGLQLRLGRPVQRSVRARRRLRLHGRRRVQPHLRVAGPRVQVPRGRHLRAVLGMRRGPRLPRRDTGLARKHPPELVLLLQPPARLVFHGGGELDQDGHPARRPRSRLSRRSGPGCPRTGSRGGPSSASISHGPSRGPRSPRCAPASRTWARIPDAAVGPARARYLTSSRASPADGKRSASGGSRVGEACLPVPLEGG